MLEKKTKKKLVAVCAAAAVMLVGGISAYFTSTDSAENTWTVGNVAIDLQEPEYDDSDKTNITPNQDLAKDPQVENTGSNDAFVFIEFSVPKADVTTAADDGKLNAKTVQELFDYTINSGWIKVNETSGTDSNTYLYAYASNGKCTSLAAEDTTPVLFKDGIIKFKNIVEGSVGDEVTIPVTAYAIQTENIGSSGSTAPSDVWAVLDRQSAE